MPDSEISVVIGDVAFTETELSGVRWQGQLRGMATAEFTLDCNAEKTRRVAMTDPVEIRSDDYLHFGGRVVEARARGKLLQLKCEAAPQFNSDLTGFVARTSVLQGMRMLALDGGARVPEADDRNLVCKASTRSLDWDDLLNRVQEAGTCGDALRIIGDAASGIELSKPEKELLERGLARIRQAVTEAGLHKNDVRTIPASGYRSAMAEWRADAWRYRWHPDDHEVIVPVRDMVVPQSSVTIGDVTFMDSSSTSVMKPYLTGDAGEWFRTDWDAPVLARTVVAEGDLWSAKRAGREKIVRAIELLVFRLNFSLGHWKLADADYTPVRYQRPSGACPAVAGASLVHNLATDEFWLGLAGCGQAPDLVELRARGGPLFEALCTTPSEKDLRTDLGEHVRAALHWSYRAALSESLIDRFLLRWIAMEMLLSNDHEDAGAVIRRTPFAIVSLGEKVKPLRRELQDRWLPLRNRIAHQAIQADPELAAGAARVQFFLDATIAHAVAKARENYTFGSWLAYLDQQGLSAPPVRETAT